MGFGRKSPLPSRNPSAAVVRRVIADRGQTFVAVFFFLFHSARIIVPNALAHRPGLYGSFSPCSTAVERDGIAQSLRALAVLQRVLINRLPARINPRQKTACPADAPSEKT